MIGGSGGAMKPQWMSRRIFAATAAAAMGVRARAQEMAPYEIVIAFPPGGTSTASLAPMVSPLGALLGAPVTLEYKPGAGGDLAATSVAKAKPDGRTLLFGHAGPLSINMHLLVQTFYDPAKELAAIAEVVRFPIVVCAHARLGVDALPGLVERGRARTLTLGSSGHGSIQHLAGELFSRRFGVRIVHLPFLGGGPLQEALVKGALDILCETGSNIVRHVQEGRLKPIAVMAPQRLALLPDVPTFGELGHDGFDISAWFGLLGPAATPPEVVNRISSATLKTLEDPAVRAAFAAIGGLPTPRDPPSFTRFIAEERERWGEVVRNSNLQPLGSNIGVAPPR